MIEKPSRREFPTDDSTIKRASRRAFLKGSTAAGLVLAGGLSVARAAHPAGSDEIKLALIGCGGRGTGAASQALRTKGPIKLYAMADAFADQIEMSLKLLQKGQKGAYDRKAYGGFPDRIDVPPERRFVGFDAYQKAIDSGVDLVILAEPPGFRPAHYRAAVAAGKHVFMEKPCCVDAPGFRSLMDTNKMAEHKGLKVGVGLMNRYDAKHVNGIQHIHDGAIGELILLRAYFNGAGGWFRPRKPEQTEMEFQMRNWYGFRWLSGDHIVEQHVHSLDMANWVMDDYPIEANGMGGRAARNGQIYDNHFVEYTYRSGTKLFSQCRQIVGCWSEGGVYVRGTKGASDCHGKGPVKFEANAYDQEHIALIDAIRNDTPHHEGYYGATSSMTAVLGRMATYSGKLVRWDDAMAKGPDEMPKELAWDADPPALPDEHGNYAVPVPGRYEPY